MAIVYFTYDLNQGPFRLKVSAVVILAAAHGQIAWFVVTALAGTAAILLLAAAMPAWRWLHFMGRNALIFFCLNGVVYHQVNPRLAHWFIASWPQDGWWLGVYATALSVLSLAAGVPVAMVLNRYLPQLVGRPSYRAMAAGAAADRWIVTSGAGSENGGRAGACAGARARLKQGRPAFALRCGQAVAAGRKRCFERAIGK